MATKPNGVCLSIEQNEHIKRRLTNIHVHECPHVKQGWAGSMWKCG